MPAVCKGTRCIWIWSQTAFGGPQPPILSLQSLSLCPHSHSQWRVGSQGVAASLWLAPCACSAPLCPQGYGGSRAGGPGALSHLSAPEQAGALQDCLPTPPAFCTPPRPCLHSWQVRKPGAGWTAWVARVAHADYARGGSRASLATLQKSPSVLPGSLLLHAHPCCSRLRPLHFCRSPWSLVPGDGSG